MSISAVWPNPLLWAVLHHLWQSTLFCQGVWLLTLLLRRNRASARFRLWMLASVKFLLPFSLLITAGEALRPYNSRATAPPAFTIMVQGTPQYIDDDLQAAMVAPQTLHDDAMPASVKAVLAVWLAGALLVGGMFLRRWWLVRQQVRRATRTGSVERVPIFTTHDGLEPGVYGVVRPVLLLPAGIADRLSAQQMQAILAHELCHVRRRDNLLAALHEVVQSVFWFHPLVWMIGAKLLTEREAVCDAAVLDDRNDAEVYAEGILKVCRFYVEAPNALVAGVTGADLKQRIARIVTGQMGSHLSAGRKLLVTAGIAAAVAAPLCFGVVKAASVVDMKIPHPQAPPPPAPQKGPPPPAPIATAMPATPDYKLISVKHSNPYAPGIGIGTSMTGMFTRNLTVTDLIAHAYGIGAKQIIGGPRWMDTEKFDLELSIKPKDLESVNQQAMLRRMLADVFGVRVHTSTRSLPVYVLMVAADGHHLRQDESNPKGLPRLQLLQPGTLDAKNASVADFCNVMQQLAFDRPLVDRTGLKGRWDFDLQWHPEMVVYARLGLQEPPNGAADVSPPVIKAVHDQMGLRMEAATLPVSVLVLDRAVMPRTN